MLSVLPFFVYFSGLILGLGAVTVIDVHAFLGRHSTYWTEATVRTHKITKPLIWLGTFLSIGGGLFVFRDAALLLQMILAAIAFALIVNGSYLSFIVSPVLLRNERAGRAQAILPAPLQRAVFVSFLVSFFGWWSVVLLTSLHFASL